MEISTYLRFVVALILVIGLILGFAWVMKRFGFGGGLQGALGRKRRLATIEATALDSRHRVILLRRDNVEHLVLVGPNTSRCTCATSPAGRVNTRDAPWPRPTRSFS